MKNLSEGIKITSKERQKVKENIDLFQMGVEYEFHTSLKVGSDDNLDSIGEHGFFTVIESAKLEDGMHYTDYLDNIDYPSHFIVINNLNIGDTQGSFAWSHSNGLIYEDTTVFDNILDMFDMSAEEDIKKMCTAFIEIVESVSHTTKQDQLDFGDNYVKLLKNRLLEYNDKYAYARSCLEWITELSDTTPVERLFGDSKTTFDDIFYLISASTSPEKFIEYIKTNSEHLISVCSDPEMHILSVLEKHEFDNIDHMSIFLGICEKISCDVGVFYFDNDTVVKVIDADYDVDYDDVYEDDGQIELRTHTESISKGLYHMDQMFSFIHDHAVTDNTSGMHISVSVRDHVDRKNVDFMKFLVLSEIGHVIDTVFPERNHVSNIVGNIKGVIRFEVAHEDGLLLADKSYIIPFLTKEILRSDVFSEKYQSIKFGDYNALDGRIELRYFGGNNYHEIYDEIEEELYRILYILMVSYTDEYEKEYKKTLFKLIDRIIEEEHEHSKTLSFFKRLVRKYGEQPSEEQLQEIYDIINDSDLPKQNKETIKGYYS